jgi:hypothetical protein
MADANTRLSATEAYVLLSLPRYDAVKALKTGFMGLIAQGVLRLEIENRPGLIRTRHIPHLTVAPNLPEPLPPIADSLVKVARTAEPQGLMKDVVRHGRRKYGNNLFAFARDNVCPALAQRGLAEKRRLRLLGLIPTSRYERTAAGDVERIRLQNALHEAKTIPRFLDKDPAQIVALVAAAGNAILLVEELRPFYDQLSRKLSGSDGGGNMFADTGGFAGGSSVTNFDFSHVDFSSFDAGGFASFDAGFSDGGGGDGGGDGGGSSGC